MSPARAGVLTAFVLVIPACRTPPPPIDGRDAITFVLPVGGLDVGSPIAAPILIEFGSYTCPYCEKFHSELLPLIGQEYVATGRLRYRYVEVRTDSAVSEMAGLVECLRPIVGLLAAKAWAFKALSSGEAPVRYRGPGEHLVSDRDLLSCARQGESRRNAEAATATELGVSGTPTFVIGVSSSDGRVVGFPVVGYSPGALREYTARVVATFGPTGMLFRLRESSRRRHDWKIWRMAE
jgi:hypothetical protein